MPPSARDLDLRQHHGVETPEHVDVQFELAGVGSRVAAGLLDLLVQGLVLVALWIGGGALGRGVFSPRGVAQSRVRAVMISVDVCIMWGYLTLFGGAHR